MKYLKNLFVCVIVVYIHDESGLRDIGLDTEALAPNFRQLKAHAHVYAHFFTAQYRSRAHRLDRQDRVEIFLQKQPYGFRRGLNVVDLDFRDIYASFFANSA